MIELKKAEILESIEKLDSWIERNGWEGYDPYDILGTSFFVHFQRAFKNLRPVTFAMELLLKKNSIPIRKIFRIKKRINPKAMALFARAYIKLYNKTKKISYLEKAEYCLNWLIENPSKGYHGLCWGYPFDWQSDIFIPEGTPLCVPTALAGHAFIDYYLLTNNKKYLDIANDISYFFINDLNITESENNALCFSYSPLDKYTVLNANLYSSAFLARLSKHIKNEKFKDLSLRSAAFTINNQNTDGSWFYHISLRGNDNRNSVIDNYHTGIVLEWLYIIKKSFGQDINRIINIDNSIRKGLEYYKSNLFLENGTPKLKNTSIYPIDIHSAAQSIVTFSYLDDIMENGNIRKNVLIFTIKNMQDIDGHFFYRIYKGYIDRTPYMRWGQAWMMWALSNALEE